MTRRVLPLIGLLLAIMIAIPAIVRGQEEPDEPESYAVSDSVARILDRAQGAIDEAKSGDPLFTFFWNAIGGWSREVLAPVVGTADIRIDVADSHQVSLDLTACLRTDIALIEAKMETVRETLNEMLESRHITAIVLLSDLYKYLGERKARLLEGSVNPHLEDQEALAERDFGPEDWEADEDERFCHFHSDYLPPSLAGYGCDVEALTAILDELPAEHTEIRRMVESEAEALRLVQGGVETYMAGAQTIAQLQQSIDLLAQGKNVPPATALPPRTHKTFQGCAPDPEDEEGSNSSLPGGMVYRTLRGNFSIDPDELGLMQSFQYLRTQGERDRPYPEDIQDVESASGDTFFMNEIKRGPQNDITDFTFRQAKDESRVFAVGGDPLLATERSLRELLGSVGQLSRLASAKDGLRRFVVNFAYFLRRSCLDRPCNEKLDRILHLVFAEECFPYVSGAYLTDTCEKPRWKKCYSEAYGVAMVPEVCPPAP